MQIARQRVHTMQIALRGKGQKSRVSSARRAPMRKKTSFPYNNIYPWSFRSGAAYTPRRASPVQSRHNLVAQAGCATLAAIPPVTQLRRASPPCLCALPPPRHSKPSRRPTEKPPAAPARALLCASSPPPVGGDSARLARFFAQNCKKEGSIVLDAQDNLNRGNFSSYFAHGGNRWRASALRFLRCRRRIFGKNHKNLGQNDEKRGDYPQYERHNIQTCKKTRNPIDTPPQRC